MRYKIFVVQGSFLGGLWNHKKESLCELGRVWLRWILDSLHSHPLFSFTVLFPSLTPSSFPLPPSPEFLFFHSVHFNKSSPLSGDHCFEEPHTHIFNPSEITTFWCFSSNWQSMSFLFVRHPFSKYFYIHDVQIEIWLFWKVLVVERCFL